MIADVIKSIAASNTRLAILVVWQVAVLQVCMATMDGWVVASGVAHSGRPFPEGIPDARFGYTPEGLHAWLTWLGPQGRQNYILLELFDYFPFMLSYPLFLGVLLTLASRSREPPSLIYLPWVVSLLDVVENACQVYTTSNFSQKSLTNPTWVSAASWGSHLNMLKWSCVGVTVVTLLALAGKSAFRQKQNKD